MTPRSKLAEMGIETSIDKRGVFTVDTRLNSALKLLNGHDQVGFTGDNQRRVTGWLDLGQEEKPSDRDWESWQGGSARALRESLEGRVNMKRFESAYAEFQKGGLKKDLALELKAAMPKRKRTFSEHDGEWDYDRRFEIEPFQRVKNHRVPTRILEIDAGFGISGSAGADEVNRYGCMVWGISQLIEACGIQTRIIWSCYSKGFAEKNGNTKNAQVRVTVKEPGQYLAPSLLAACFQAVFFRRMGFALLACAAEAQGAQVTWGLGSPDDRPAAEFRDGRLYISPDSARGGTHAINEAVKESIRAV